MTFVEVCANRFSGFLHLKNKMCRPVHLCSTTVLYHNVFLFTSIKINAASATHFAIIQLCSFNKWAFQIPKMQSKGNKGITDMVAERGERHRAVYKLVQMESSHPGQLLGRKSQEHEEAHSGQLPLWKAKSWGQRQHACWRDSHQVLTHSCWSNDHRSHHINFYV